MGRRRRSGARVVEREERRRPAERRGHGVLEEAVRLGVGRDARVGVDVDAAREDEQPSRVDDLVGRVGQPAEIGPDGLDPATADRDVGRERPGRGHDRSAPDDQVGHEVVTAPSVAAAAAAIAATAAATPTIAAAMPPESPPWSCPWSWPCPGPCPWS